MFEANIDFGMLVNGQFQGGGKLFSGQAAQNLLANGFDPGCLRPYVGKDGRSYVTLMMNGVPTAVPIMHNATLRKDEWKVIDQVALGYSVDRLIGINDLISRGLVFPLANAMGTTVFEYEKMTGTATAEVTMDGVQRSGNHGIEYDLSSMPIPITHSDFELNARFLAASRTRGQAMDTTKIEVATRSVNEKLEDMLFTNWTYNYGGSASTIYSYINHPDRNTGTFNGGPWDDSANGADILADVNNMILAAITAGFYGPYVLYIPRAYSVKLNEDYVSGYPKTIRARLLELEGLTDIRTADRLATDNVLLVNMSSDVVRLVDGMAVTPVQWDEEGGFKMKFKMMAIRVPNIRSDGNGNSGIVHYTA